LKDFLDAFEVGRCDAALAASLFHYGELSVSEVKEYLSSNGVVVRP
jgi:cyclase